MTESDDSRQDAKRRLVDVLNSRRRRRPDDDPRPVPAAAIARWLGLGGTNHETRRRACRKLVAELRAEGVDIAASFKGYWIPETAKDHAEHQAWLKRMGVSHLVHAAQVGRTQAASDARGQLLMFPVDPPSRGHI